MFGFVMLAIAFGLYFYVASQAHELANRLGIEHGWVSYVPVLQFYVYVKMYIAIKDDGSRFSAYLLFLGLPVIFQTADVVMNYGDDNVGYFTISSLITSVIYTYLILVLTRALFVDGKKDKYALFVFLLGPLFITIWSHRHRDAIVRNYTMLLKDDISNNGVIDGVVVKEEVLTEDVLEELLEGTLDTDIKDKEKESGEVNKTV